MQDSASSNVTPASEHRGEKNERLIARTKEVGTIPTVVVHPFDRTSLEWAPDAAKADIILPIVLSSRPDSVQTHMASCAVVAIDAHALRAGKPIAA